RRARRLAGLAVERQPDLVRRLRPDAVDAQRRKQADDPRRDRRGDHRDRLQLARLRGGQPVETRTDLLDRSGGDEPLKMREADPEKLQVAGTEEGAEAGLAQAGSSQGLVL